MNWIEYWSKPGFDQEFWRKSIEYYVSELLKAVEIHGDHRVLDYGAGPGHTGDTLSPHVKELHMVEPSLELHEQSEALNDGLENVHCYQLEGREAVARYLQSQKFDWIIMNSVSQYIPLDEGPPLFETLSGGLSENGRMCISDIVPPTSLLFRELMSVMKFYFAWFSLIDFIRYFFAEVARLKHRKQLELTTYTQESFEAAYGQMFEIEWLPNPTVCQNRYCAVLKPRR
jgi:SAM-dependent methyltransferase